MKKIITSVVIALIIGGVLGYAVGYSKGGKIVAASYASKIATVTNFFPPAPATTLTLTGQVKSISGDTITMEANPLTPNPFAENNTPTVRTVTVTSGTTITQMEQTDSATLQKEMLAYQKEMQQNSTATNETPPPALTLPMPFSETSATLADLKVDDIITVTAANDISTSASFTATKIEVRPAGPAPFNPPSSVMIK